MLKVCSKILKTCKNIWFIKNKNAYFKAFLVVSINHMIHKKGGWEIRTPAPSCPDLTVFKTVPFSQTWVILHVFQTTVLSLLNLIRFVNNFFQNFCGKIKRLLFSSLLSSIYLDSLIHDGKCKQPSR